jgi:hypothetical protein
MQTAGVAASMGLHPNPVGTPDELRREGISVAMVGSCAPPSKGVRGCSQYDKCIFRLTKNGGFRDQGPKHVGFFHETHEGHRRQEFMACFTFMQTMYERMRSGIRDREDGLRGEIIRVIAQEGETIRPKLQVNLNEGTALPHKWARKTDPKVVPPFPRPHDADLSNYDAYLINEERARQLSDPDLQVGPPVAIEDMEPEPETIIDAETVNAAVSAEPASAVPVAVPVERKKPRYG